MFKKKNKITFNIFVLDDSFFARQSIYKALTQPDNLVDVNANLSFVGESILKQEFLDLLPQINANLFFIDTELEDGSGWDVVMEIKNKIPDAYIVMLSDGLNTALQIKQDLYESEVFAILDKPAQPGSLCGVVENIYSDRLNDVANNKKNNRKIESDIINRSQKPHRRTQMLGGAAPIIPLIQYEKKQFVSGDVIFENTGNSHLNDKIDNNETLEISDNSGRGFSEDITTPLSNSGVQTSNTNIEIESSLDDFNIDQDLLDDSFDNFEIKDIPKNHSSVVDDTNTSTSINKNNLELLSKRNLKNIEPYSISNQPTSSEEIKKTFSDEGVLEVQNSSEENNNSNLFFAIDESEDDEDDDDMIFDFSTTNEIPEPTSNHSLPTDPPTPIHHDSALLSENSIDTLHNPYLNVSLCEEKHKEEKSVGNNDCIKIDNSILKSESCFKSDEEKLKNHHLSDNERINTLKVSKFSSQLPKNTEKRLKNKEKYGKDNHLWCRMIEEGKEINEKSIFSIEEFDNISEENEQNDFDLEFDNEEEGLYTEKNGINEEKNVIRGDSFRTDLGYGPDKVHEESNIFALKDVMNGDSEVEMSEEFRKFPSLEQSDFESIDEEFDLDFVLAEDEGESQKKECPQKIEINRKDVERDDEFSIEDDLEFNLNSIEDEFEHHAEINIEEKKLRSTIKNEYLDVSSVYDKKPNSTFVKNDEEEFIIKPPIGGLKGFGFPNKK